MRGVKFKLENNSKFSVKDGNGNLLNIIPSNTIFSALINNINLIYGEERATKAVELFSDSEFAISSMFIGLDFYDLSSNEPEKSIYFLPKPEALIEEATVETDSQKEEQVLNRKKAKGISMISLDALKEIGRSWDEDEERFDFNLLNLKILGTEFACTKKELRGLKLSEKKLQNMSFFDETSNPHVQINRITGASDNFFYNDEKRFLYEYTSQYRIEPFMYVLYRGDLSKDIKAGINLIVDEGIGGRRSVGMGTFLSNEYIELDIKDKKDSNIFMTLSSYVPTKEEYEHILGYKLDRADGYIYYKGGLPFRKRGIGVIREGGISRIRILGRLIDVTPLNIKTRSKIFFNGKSFVIGLGGENCG